MATRRCISGKVVESNAFYSLSLAAQALYIHIIMASDDLGFCNSTDGAICRIPGGDAAFQELKRKRFLLAFDDVSVVKHWKMANTLKNDRMKPLNYPEVAKRIWVKPNRSYTDHPTEGGKTLYEDYTGIAPKGPTGIQVESKWNPNGNLTEPNLTEPNRTEPNLTEPNRSGECVDGTRQEWFERIWSAYPAHRQGNWSEGWAAFEGSVPLGSEQAVLDGLNKWSISSQWQDENGRWVPGLAKWLVQRQWEYPPKAATKSGIQADGSWEPDEEFLKAIRRVMEQPEPDQLKGGQP